MQENDGLQRAVEQEVAAKLDEENMRLKFEMEILKHSQVKLEYGVMEYLQPGHGDKLPPPPVRSKNPNRRWMAVQEAKHTLQGIRNPDNPLPSHKLLSIILLP